MSDQPRRFSFYMSGIFMLVFLIFAGVLGGYSLWQTRDRFAAAAPQEVIEGKWALAYETAFNKTIPMYDVSKNSWGLLNYLIFREGNNGVLVGHEDWLFTAEEFYYAPDKEERLQKNLSFIRNVKDRLAAQNAALVVVLVPAKARLYASELGRYHFPAYKKDVYAATLKGLKKQQIPAVDLLSVMQTHPDKEKLFFRTDTHWTPRGAALAAAETGRLIQKDLPQSYARQAKYKTFTMGQTRHNGDLLRYVPAGGFAASLGLASDMLETVKTVDVSAEKKESLQLVLFSEETPEVTLVGTSYSANPAWNFEGYLKEALQADILNAADEGRGPFETMRAYLENDAFQKTPPRLVIWEIPERYVTFDYSDTKTGQKGA